MRTNYTLISAELNDKFQDLYYKLTYMLGYSDELGNKIYIGEFNKFETKLRKLNYNTALQLDNNNLVLDIDNMNIKLYTVWGRHILINKLRSM